MVVDMARRGRGAVGIAGRQVLSMAMTSRGANV